MRWLSYTWRVFLGIVELVIIILVVTKFTAPFERTAIDILVITYLAVATFMATSGLVAIDNSKPERDRFLKLLKATGSTEFETEEWQYATKEDDERATHVTYKIYISCCFQYAMFLFALWNLVGALNS